MKAIIHILLRRPCVALFALVAPFLMCFLASASWGHAGWNSIALSDSVVSFGAVATDSTYSIELTLLNNLSIPVEILSVLVDEDVFETDLTTGEIPALGARVFNVCFSSGQNVDYAAFLSIEMSDGIRPIICELSAAPHYPGTYYSSTQNKWGEELKDVLTDIIDGHNSLGYNLARDHMYGHIDNVDGWVECVYTGRKAYFSTRQGATENNFNCEHTWPQSFSGEAEPMKSDIYHLYPSDVTANNKRSNLDFGVVVSPSWSSGGSKLGTDSEGQTVFEPRDVHKGNVARTHFYYIIRYDGNYNGYQDAAKMEAHLRNWHVSDPVDSAEIERNDEISALQYNRNPFIDHPALVNRISSFFGTAVYSEAPEIVVSPGSVDMGTIGFDTTATYHIAVMNSGSDTLNILLLTSSNPEFIVSGGCFALAPGTYDYVSVGYASGDIEAADSTSISIASDDDDESLVDVPVRIQVSDLSGVAGDIEAPAGLFLRQNHPNPFRRRTTISFGVSRGSAIDLSIYSIHGRLVSRVLDGAPTAAGVHNIEFAAEDLPPGIYYCRLSAGGEVVSRRMVILN